MPIYILKYLNCYLSKSFNFCCVEIKRAPFGISDDYFMVNVLNERRARCPFEKSQQSHAVFNDFFDVVQTAERLLEAYWTRRSLLLCTVFYHYFFFSLHRREQVFRRCRSGQHLQQLSSTTAVQRLSTGGSFGVQPAAVLPTTTVPACRSVSLQRRHRLQPVQQLLPLQRRLPAVPVQL